MFMTWRTVFQNLLISRPIVPHDEAMHWLYLLAYRPVVPSTTTYTREGEWHGLARTKNQCRFLAMCSLLDLRARDQWSSIDIWHNTTSYVKGFRSCWRRWLERVWRTVLVRCDVSQPSENSHRLMPNMKDMEIRVAWRNEMRYIDQLFLISWIS